ncbi:DivIVA domain-containing protein [Streptomyces candidus]|uniref:DivIVA domain-containing protein n=1 Tax=Streptomyces candidus TaxID=67283 RepID=A0A7X0HFE7_9ACTN|nr:DivIVA domain-containing protein [Streptomyces candidus]
MFFFLLLAMVVVVAAVTLAVVGGGDEGTLPEAGPDHLTDPLPLTRPVGRADIEALRLPLAPRGYRMADVDDVLGRVGAELAERDARIAELEAALAGAGTRTAHDDRTALPADPAPRSWAAPRPLWEPTAPTRSAGEPDEPTPAFEAPAAPTPASTAPTVPGPDAPAPAGPATERPARDGEEPPSASGPGGRLGHETGGHGLPDDAPSPEDAPRPGTGSAQEGPGR